MNEQPTFIYRVCRYICFLIFKTGWRLEVRNWKNFPQTGPIIIAANHKSYADPPLVGVSVMPRPIYFLAKKELFDFKPFGWLIGHLNATPLNRSSGAEAVKAAQSLLAGGKAVIVFPEGRRIRTEEFGAPKAGVGLLSISTQTPVIPVYIHNSNKMTMFKKITVTFGKPIYPQKNHTYESLAKEVMDRIGEMKREREG